jgi:hypothetical protein
MPDARVGPVKIKSEKPSGIVVLETTSPEKLGWFTAPRINGVG